jgi:osmotically inducible lipoprotein OsmB
MAVQALTPCLFDKEQTMVKILMASILVISLAFGGCAGMTDTQQRTLSGGAMGAAGGAIIGAIAGDAAMGAAIGGAAGLAGGFLYDKHKKSQESAYEAGYQQGRKTKPKP